MSTITGGLGADSLTGGTGADTFVFTSGLSIDTVTDFTLADDVAAFDLSELETLGAVIAARTIDVSNGLGSAVAAGDTVSILTVAGATTTTAANVFVYTAATIADAAALDTALSNGGGLLTVGAGGAVALGDSFVFQYTTAAGVERLAIVTANAAYAAAAKIADVEVTDIAIVGTTADLGASNYAFIA